MLNNAKARQSTLQTLPLFVLLHLRDHKAASNINI